VSINEIRERHSKRWKNFNDIAAQRQVVPEQFMIDIDTLLAHIDRLEARIDAERCDQDIRYGKLWDENKRLEANLKRYREVVTGIAGDTVENGHYEEHDMALDILAAFDAIDKEGSDDEA